MDDLSRSQAIIHLLQLTVKIQRVKLAVRFPCTLSFELKADDKLTVGRGNYQLQKGECFPGETLRIDVQAEKHHEIYMNKTAHLVIYMSSTTGRIPAGSVPIVFTQQQLDKSRQYTDKIQKCPDRNACVNFILITEFKRIIQRNDGLSHSKFDDSLHRKSRVNSYNRLPKQRKFFDSSAGKNKLKYSNLNSSRAYGNQSIDRQNRRSTFSRSEDERQGDMTKVNQLEHEKAELSRELNQIKSQMYSNQNNELNNMDEHLLRYKDEIDELTFELESARQKNRMLEKRQKELASINRELKDQLDRKQQKNNLNEYIKMENQSVLEEKDKTIRNLQSDLKAYQQQLSDLKISLNTQSKRIEFKEASFKEQLSKLNDKYQQSQKERQNAVHELNKMLEEMEKTEKKNQLNLKEKERSFFEEKNKINKKNQQIQRRNDQLKQEVENNESLISDLQRQVKALQSKINAKDEDIKELKHEVQMNQNQYKKEQQTHKVYEKEIQQLKSTQKSYHSLKKKNLETSQNLEKQKEKAQKLSHSITQLQSKIKQHQDMISEKNNEVTSLNAKITNLHSQYQNLRKQDEQRQRQAQTLSLTNLNAAQRIEELRSKVDISEMKYTELQNQYDEEMGYLLKSKEYLQGELDEYKWNYEKCKENYEQINNKYKLVNEEILILNKKLLQAEQRHKKQEQAIRDYQSQLNTVTNDKQILERKEKQYQEFLKTRNNEIYELNKKIHEIEKDCFMLEQKNKHAQKFYNEKLGSDEQAIKQKESAILQKGQEINQLQIQQFEQTQTIHKLEKDKIILTEEIDYIKQYSDNLKEENKTHKLEIENLRQKIDELKSQLEEANSFSDEKTQSNTTLQKSISDLNKEWQQYRQNTFSAMQQLVDEIGKDEDNLKYTLLSFPDDQLSSLQVEAIKKRNAIIQKYRESINDLKANLSTSEYELVKNKKFNEEHQQEMEIQLQREKDKLKTYITQTSLEKEQLFQKIRTLEDKVHDLFTQGEHMNIELAENKSMILELEQIIQENNFAEQNLKTQIKGHEQTIKSLTEELAKTRQQFDNEIANMNEQKLAQMEKAKKNLTDSEKRSLSLEKANLEMQENIRKLQNSLAQVNYQRDKNQQKLLELNNKYLDSIKDNKTAIEAEKHQQKHIKELIGEISTLESENMFKQKRIEEITLLKKKLQQMIAQEQTSKNKLKNELDVCSETIRQLEDRLKDTGDKGKKANEKYLKQIKQLKQNIIGLNSDIDLKKFQLQQKQATLKTLKETVNEQSQELGFKKKDTIELQSQIQKYKGQSMLLKQQLETTLNEKQSLESQVRNLKDMNENMNEELNSTQATAQMLTLKERQIQKLKQQQDKSSQVSEKTITELKNAITEGKKQLTNRTAREEELKKKIRELEKVIEEKEYDLEAEKKNWLENSDLQRSKLRNELQQLKQDYHNLQQQGEFQRQQLQEQLKTAHDENIKVSELLEESEKAIQNQQQLIQQNKEKIAQLKKQLKKCQQDWKGEKQSYIPTQKDFKYLQSELTKYQKYFNEVTVKNKQLLELLRKKSHEENQFNTADILRQVSTIITKNKLKIIQKAGSEKEKEQIMLDFKQISQKIDSGIKLRQR